MRKGHALLLIILLAIGGLGGWALSQQQNPSDQAAIEAPNEIVVAFQRMAEESCKCTRNGGSETACWSEFNAKKSRTTSEFGTACDLGSISGECFETDKGEVCVTTRFGVDGVCNANESRIVQEVHSKAYRKVMAKRGFPDRLDWENLTEQETKQRESAAAEANSAAQAAIENVLTKLRRGEAVESSGTVGGCAA